MGEKKGRGERWKGTWKCWTLRIFEIWDFGQIHANENHSVKALTLHLLLIDFP